MAKHTWTVDTASAPGGLHRMSTCTPAPAPAPAGLTTLVDIGALAHDHPLAFDNATSYKRLDEKGNVLLALRRKDTSSAWQDVTALEQEKAAAIAAHARLTKELERLSTLGDEDDDIL